ncbi:MAG: thioredoxin domain-containing protein [Clostridium sp.]|nr:thioredoxin domain-containing protein [Clostridium sp.]MCM1444711.1 thioredoxin domain-containing protein [Candidatus Amulumruptor caecigallinarius]
MKILKFNAMWCSGCLVMKKTINEIKELYPDIDIIDYDYDIDTLEVEKWNVGTIIPVMIFLDKNDNEIIRLKGEKSKKEIIKVIEEIKNEKN